MYLTFSSSSSPEFFPMNKVSDYIAHLPKELNFKGFLKVNLAEVIFSHSWHKIETKQHCVIYQRGDVHMTTKASGYYQHPQHLVCALLSEKSGADCEWDLNKFN